MAELDYKKMFETLMKRVTEMQKSDTEYFALFDTIAEHEKYSRTVSRSMIKMNKADQIKCLRLLAEYSLLSKDLCEKYNLLPKSDEGESDND